MDFHVPCETCGCTEYTQQSGFFICNNCSTQSQNLAVQEYDSYNFRTAAADDDPEREEVISNKSFAERKQTSWECYNILLAGLVDELIDLGASRKIKVVAFQLWAAYLQRSKIAFTSKTEEVLPALSLGFRNTDVETLYGISDLKSKLFKNRRKKQPRKRQSNNSASSVSSSKSSKSIKLKQRKKDMEETLNQSNSKVPVVETLESLELERASKKILKREVVFKSSVLPVLEELAPRKPAEHASPENVQENKTKFKNKLHAVIYRRQHKTPSERAPNILLSSVTIITILRVALQLVNDEIFLGDILRWICEGRLSVNQPDKFVPSFYKLVKKYDLLNAQRRAFQLEIRNLTYNLNLSDLPTPNLFKLAERYCFELCLPDDFLKFVLKLMVDSNMKMDYENYQFRIFPDYECRVMAFILFVFKLLFSLDDFTEFQQSAFADAVNELQQSQSKDEIPRLFSWNSWLKFMECRKSVLSGYNLPISELASCEKYCEENVFLNHWGKVKSTCGTSHAKINEALLSSLDQEISSMSYENGQHCDEKEFVVSPASVTPWNTLTEHVLKEYSHLLCSRTKKILSESFKTYSIKYAMDSKWCCEIAESLNMKMEFYNFEDIADLEIYSKSINPFPATGTNHVVWNRPVPLLLRKTPPPKRNSEDELSKFQSSIIRIGAESAGQSQEYEMKLCNASPYWCVHENSSASVEEFEALARQTLPRSFLWLFCECCAMLRTDVKTLYCQLMFVENVLHRLYGKHQSKKQILMNEW